jgi:drug/metabolite transporter (DMT)-like permease
MAFLAVRGKSLRLTKRDIWKVALLGFVMFSVNTTLVNYSSRVVPAGVTALMLATIPLMIGVLDAALPNGRKMTAISWAAIVTGFLGIAVLISGSIVGKPSGGATAWACAGLVVAAAAWAVGSIAAQRMTFAASPILLSAWQMLIGGSINLVAGVSMGGTHVSHWTRPVWMAVLYLAICGSLASYTSYLFLLRNVRLSTVATYAYINPVVAVVLGSLLLNESLQPMQLAGMIIVLVSVAVVAAPKPSRQKAESDGDVQYQNPSLKETS